MENIEKVFDGVTLIITPTGIQGIVTQEEAAKAVKRHAVKSIHEGDFVEAELCSLFDLAIRMCYEQVSKESEESESIENEKETILRVIEKAIDQNLFDEVIYFAEEDLSSSWAVSFLHAEKELLK